MSKIVIEGDELAYGNKEVEAESFICGAIKPNGNIAIATYGMAGDLLPMLLSMTKDVLSNLSPNSPLRAAFFATLIDEIATPSDIDVAADMIEEMRC